MYSNDFDDTEYKFSFTVSSDTKEVDDNNSKPEDTNKGGAV
jgi:hypothetical protein